MMKCNKCGHKPSETDKIVWKCTSCGKTYGVKLSYLQKLQEKKDSFSAANLIKCKECGKPLDNGAETIFWKCSCGTVQKGTLDDYRTKEKAAIISHNDNNKTNISNNKSNTKIRKRAVIIFSVLITFLVLGTIIYGIVNKTINNKENEINNLLKEADNYYNKLDFDNVSRCYDQLGSLDYNIAEKQEILKYDVEVYDKIIEFHNVLIDIRKKINTTNYKSLRLLANELLTAINQFEEININMTSDFGKYINLIKNNPMYQNLKENLLNNKELDLDYPLTTSAYAMLITDHIDIILEEDIPYHDDTKVTNKDIVQETPTYTPKVTNTPKIKETPKPVKIQDKIKLKVTNKKNLPVNYDVGQYSEFIELDYKVINNTNRSIKGIKGKLNIYDQFNDFIMIIDWDVSEGIIKPHQTIKVNEWGLDYNQFKHEHQKLYNTNYEDLIFKYEIEQINFANGDKLVCD